MKRRSRTITVLASILVALFACSAVWCSGWLGGFRIVREVILPVSSNGVSLSIAKSIHESYFIVGAGNDRSALAVKVDARGQRQWEFQEPIPDTIFFTALTEPDDGVFLCGWQGKNTNDSFFGSGIAVRLDKNGKELWRFSLDLDAPDRVGRLSKIASCTNWGNDVAFVSTGGAPGYAVFRMTHAGEIIWKKSVYVKNIPDLVLDRPRAMSNGDLVLGAAGDITRIDAQGQIVAHAQVIGPPIPTGPAGCSLIQPVYRTDTLKIACLQGGAGHFLVTEIVDLAADLSIVKRTMYPSGNVATRHVYALADGSILLLGFRDSGWGPVPTLLTYSPEGKIDGSYQFRGLGDSGWILDGIFTGKPGEFVTLHNREGVNSTSKTIMTLLKRF